MPSTLSLREKAYISALIFRIRDAENPHREKEIRIFTRIVDMFLSKNRINDKQKRLLLEALTGNAVSEMEAFDEVENALNAGK